MPFTPALFAAAALTFWAPGHEAQVCPQGVAIHTKSAFTAADVILDADAGQTLGTIAAAAPVGVGRCDLTLNLQAWRKIRWPEMRCAIVVHELGHSVMGLHHSPDPHSVMHYVPNIPRMCLRLVRSERQRDRGVRVWRRAIARWGWRTVR